MVMVTLTMTHLCNGMFVSLQAPFYPAEAERKGASATEYGLVFGIFELTVFIVSPIIGKYLPRIGIDRAFIGGISITGLMCVAFGFLNRVGDCKSFIALSFVNRIVGAIGNSAFLSASFTMVAQIFPNSVSSMFGLVEMSFGVGMIIGPAAGGALFQLGGFTTPFGVLGGILLVQAILSIKILPTLKTDSSESSGGDDIGVIQALKIPSVVLATFSVFSASIAVGALQATLERHLAQFDLSSMHIGMIFMLYGGAYAFLNPFWGWMADRVSSKLVIMIGAFLLCLGFLLVGPVPGLGIKSSYSLCIVSVVIAGVGLGAQLVAAFSEAQRSAVSGGFPDNLTTYALVSSLWTSAFALGAFVGPTAAGALYDAVGFEWSTLFTVGWNAAVFIAALSSLLVVWVNKGNREHYKYSVLEGDNVENGSLAEQVDRVKEGRTNLSQSDRYQT